MLDSTGKKATMNAQASSASRMSSTQMMMSGAMATMGVTCRMTA